MLCDYHTLPDGRDTKPITWCNIEGYNGMHPRFLPTTKRMLSEMPDGRCPYPQAIGLVMAAKEVAAAFLDNW